MSMFVLVVNQSSSEKLNKTVWTQLGETEYALS